MLTARRSQAWFHRLTPEQKAEYLGKFPGSGFHCPPKLVVHSNPVGIEHRKTAPLRETVAINSFRNETMNSATTVNIVDFQLKSPTLAKVIISFTGNVDTDYIKDAISKKLGHSAAVVASSFKEVREGVAVGFIRANKAVRVLDGSEAQVTAKYRVMSSNILMDKEDKSLWDMKIGASGKYLTCRGQEDLSELVSAAVQRRSDVPRLAHIAIAKAAQSELVAFVDDSGEVDHGFAIATSESQVKVLSYSRRIPVTVDYDSVVSIHPVAVPKRVQAEVSASLTSEQKKQAKDYYTRLYGYNPEYMNQVIQQINEGTLA